MKREHLAQLSIAGAVVTVSLLPFAPFLGGVPASHDLPDHLAMATQYLEGFGEGRLYPRWSGDFNHGWGEPTGVFYPPGLYYLTALGAAASGGDVLRGLIAALVVLSLVGTIGVYVLASPRAGRGLALLACAFHAVAPYRAFELYSSGLFSAYAAGCFVPWLLLSLWRLAAARDAARYLAWGTVMAASFACIILMNLPCAVLVVYLVAAWLLLEIAVTRNWRLIATTAAGGVAGASLAALYLLPAVLEMSSIVVPHAQGPPLFESNFLFQTEGSWMGPGLWSLFARMGGYSMLLLAVSAAMVWAFRVSGAGSHGSWLRLVACFGAVAAFLTTTASRWLWAGLPFLERVNMPWRLLDHLAVPAAVLAAAAVAGAWRQRQRWRWGRASGFAAIAILALLSIDLDTSLLESNERVGPEHTGALVNAFCSRAGYFLPAGAAAPESLRHHPLIVVETPGATAEVKRWTSSRRRLRLVCPQQSRFALRTYYYPGWTARLVADPRRELPLSADAANGRMLLDVPAGEHEVVLSFESVPARTAGALLSALALLALGAVWSGFLWRRRRLRASGPRARRSTPEPSRTASA